MGNVKEWFKYLREKVSMGSKKCEEVKFEDTTQGKTENILFKGSISSTCLQTAFLLENAPTVNFYFTNSIPRPTLTVHSTRSYNQMLHCTLNAM